MRNLLEYLRSKSSLFYGLVFGLMILGSAGAFFLAEAGLILALSLVLGLLILANLVVLLI